MIKTRPATPDDCADLCQMIGLLAHHHGDTPAVSVTSLRQNLFCPIPWAEVLVVDGPTELQGYCALTRAIQLQRAGRTMDLHHLFVREKMRGTGVGQALVAAAVARARRRRCLWLSVSTAPDNLAAQAFYGALGFQPNQSQAARFWLDLTPPAP